MWSKEQGTLLKLMITELGLFTSDHLVFQVQRWGCLSEFETEVPYFFLLKHSSEPLSKSLTSCTYPLHHCSPFLFTCRPHPQSLGSQPQLSVVTKVAHRLVSSSCVGFRNNKKGRKDSVCDAHLLSDNCLTDNHFTSLRNDPRRKGYHFSSVVKENHALT